MNKVNKIEIVQVNDVSYELEMSTFKQMLYQIHLLKPKGVNYNRFTNRWACPITVFPELKENISLLAEIIEPTGDEPIRKRIKTTDKTLANKESENKIISISHLNPFKLKVELSVYNSAIVKELKEIQGAYFQKPYWIISVDNLSLLKNKLEQFTDWEIRENLQFDTVN